MKPENSGCILAILNFLLIYNGFICLNVFLYFHFKPCLFLVQFSVDFFSSMCKYHNRWKSSMSL